MALIYGKQGPGRTETIIGTAQDDEIHPLGGNDTVDGGRGHDRVIVEAASTDFRITTVNGVTYLDTSTGASSGSGVTLKNVEMVVFKDRELNLVVHDRLINTPAADFLDGGPGTDTFVLQGDRSAYQVSGNYEAATTSVRRTDGGEGGDFLANVERLNFNAGRALALDMGDADPAGKAVLLIGAVLGKALLPLKEELMGTAISLFDQGFTMQQLAGAVQRLPIWGGVLTATNSNADIARYLLRTVQKTEPGDAAVAAAAAALAAESPQAQGTWLAQLATSAANQIQVDLVGLQSTGFAYTIPPGG